MVFYLYFFVRVLSGFFKAIHTGAYPRRPSAVSAERSVDITNSIFSNIGNIGCGLAGEEPGGFLDLVLNESEFE